MTQYYIKIEVSLAKNIQLKQTIYNFQVIIQSYFAKMIVDRYLTELYRYFTVLKI